LNKSLAGCEAAVVGAIAAHARCLSGAIDGKTRGFTPHSCVIDRALSALMSAPAPGRVHVVRSLLAILGRPEARGRRIGRTARVPLQLLDPLRPQQIGIALISCG